ncbi:tetratricopeptide repeat protein [Fontivita pretiosa]|uniref:tetratricopeptide repeat protein n=1 Tax=Fontivita pretiosa TaxID=2989684 RepID=UPI003D16288E
MPARVQGYIAFALTIILAIGPVSADVLVLKDGTRLQGDVKRGEDGWLITLPDGTTRAVALGAVRSIELGATSGPASGPARGAEPAAAELGLASLRRSVEALSDINQIIQRYERFIENTRDARIVAEAQIDLSMWRERRDRGLVKYGNQWISPQQVQILQAQATSLAVEARELMRQNKLREAEQILQQALELDPHNPSAHYLRGVALYRQNKFAEARKEFEAVNARLERHAPTLNNLGVILYRLNAQNAALNYFDQAMEAEPVNRFILDNVAEALGAIPPEEQRKNNLVARVVRRFAEQDLVLQHQMAQQGLYRWGGQWINQKALDELKAAERQVRERLQAIQMEFDQATARMAQIDDQIRRNQEEIAELKRHSLFIDKDGTAHMIPLPRRYYDLLNDNRSLEEEKRSLATKQAMLREQVKRVQQQVPVPQFTGIMQIVGVEGMPPAAAETAEPPPAPPIDASPTTGPASQPVDAPTTNNALGVGAP